MNNNDLYVGIILWLLVVWVSTVILAVLFHSEIKMYQDGWKRQGELSQEMLDAATELITDHKKVVEYVDKLEKLCDLYKKYVKILENDITNSN